MGDGPCGPNTEIYFDFRGEKGLPKKIEDLDNKRFIEICNIVFPEFYHKGNDYLPLAEKCVDTGAGLERIVMVLQGKKNAFEIDLWEPVINLMETFHKENLLLRKNNLEKIRKEADSCSNFSKKIAEESISKSIPNLKINIHRKQQ